MKKRLKLDNHILDIFNLKFIPYMTQIVLLEQFNNFNVGKICWTSTKNLDNNINLMKSNALNYIFTTLSCFKKTEFSEQIIGGFTSLIKNGIELFEYLISNKYEYLKTMSNNSIEYPDYNYEILLYNYLSFISRVLLMEPFKNLFSSFIFK